MFFPPNSRGTELARFGVKTCVFFVLFNFFYLLFIGWMMLNCLVACGMVKHTNWRGELLWQLVAL